MHEGAPPAALALACATTAVLVAIHLFSGRLRFLEGTPRSIWLSVAGGVSVAYVFVHLLPELSQAQADLRAAMPVARFAEHHVYVIALAGLIAFYGLEKLAITSRAAGAGTSEGTGEEDATGRMPTGMFWVHVASFGVYNGLVGYLLLHREKPGLASLLWFAIAMALHFLVADYGLREHYRELYDRIGRYVLSAAVALGLALGWATEVGRPALAVLFGFLAGGVMLNVLKEEMPKERKSRFWAFALGAGAYAALLLFT